MVLTSTFCLHGIIRKQCNGTDVQTFLADHFPSVLWEQKLSDYFPIQRSDHHHRHPLPQLQHIKNPSFIVTANIKGSTEYVLSPTSNHPFYKLSDIFFLFKLSNPIISQPQEDSPLLSHEHPSLSFSPCPIDWFTWD